jgi:signal transduction histidine kinase
MPADCPSFLDSAADFGRRALGAAELDKLLIEAVNIIVRQLRVEFSSVLELLPDGRAVFQAGVGWRDGLIGQVNIEMGPESLASYVIRTQTPLAVSDLRIDGRFVVSPLLREHGILGSLFVPIQGQTRPLGVLGAHSSQPRSFSADDTAWLQVLANALAFRLDHKWHSQGEYDKQLLRAEQMMAIGQVAAGVAHELRNPLTSIKGLVQVNRRDFESKGLPAEDLTVIEHEIRRMERTLQTFLDFARPPKPDRHLLDLAIAVDLVFALVAGRARKQHVSLQFVRPEAPVYADVDQDQLQQLLLNLVLNALDAMPQGGNIEIELRPPRDGFLELYVRDSGPGIAPHILPKVFETFVSNKETGIGLGVPLSLRIAEDHGGTLTAYNLPVAGACFLLRLPAR